MSSKPATTHIFQSGVRNWPVSVSRREIEVFNPQAWELAGIGHLLTKQHSSYLWWAKEPHTRNSEIARHMQFAWRFWSWEKTYPARAEAHWCPGSRVNLVPMVLETRLVWSVRWPIIECIQAQYTWYKQQTHERNGGWTFGRRDSICNGR